MKCVWILSALFGAVAARPSGAPPGMCPSPSGWHPCECIHEVASGSRIEEHLDAETTKRSVRIYDPSGAMRELEECAAPWEAGRAAAPSPIDAQPAGDPCQLGYAHAAPMEAFYRHPMDIAFFNATQTVPEPPSVTENNILYYWIGLQDYNSSANPVIQPVLSYVPGSSSNNWYFESWNCCPAGHKLKATSVGIKGPGERVQATLTRDVDAGTYSIISTNATGASSILISNDTNSGIVKHWNWVDIVLETYSVDSCAQYSAGGTANFSDMTLVDVSGRSVTPNFTMAPYINDAYPNATISAEFTACCNGQFPIAWPNAYMANNGKDGSRVIAV